MAKGRCDAIEPSGLIGQRVQCDLKAGHAGKHKASREKDGWKSGAEWAPDGVDDEVRLLRKLAAAAGAYLDVSEIKQSMYWAQQLKLHNLIAEYRNMRARPPGSEESGQ